MSAREAREKLARYIAIAVEATGEGSRSGVFREVQRCLSVLVEERLAEVEARVRGLEIQAGIEKEE